MEQFKLYNKDCFKTLKKIESNSIDCIITDPPYFLSNDGITCKSGKMVSVNKGDWDKSKGFNDIYNFNFEWIKECFRVLKLGGTLWVSGTYHNIYIIGSIIQSFKDFKILNNITWIKTSPPPNLSCRFFTHSTETVLWVRKGLKSKHYFNYELMKKWNSDKQMKDVWIIGRPKKIEKSFGNHPTQKPEEIIERMILSSTQENELVLDPFCGSGTTGVVSCKHNRKFIGIDLEKKYINITKKRIENILMVKERMDVKPILKWVGGKRELVPVIREYYKDLDFKRYIEPFFGGGSVYFDIIKTFGEDYSKKSIINDVNTDLINLYKHIKSNPEGVMKYCDKLEKDYYKHGFYYIRDRFNGIDRDKNKVERYEGIERSSSLIVLNKTCFNGLYRVNSKGLFNVPEGRYKNPTIYFKENILNMSHNLPSVKNIRNIEFDKIKTPRKGDLVYFDPPYHPLNETSSFTSYSGSFGREEQIRLRDYFKELDKKGVYVILSNSSSEFIKEIYSEFKIIEVFCKRSINSKSEKRGKIPEYLVLGNTLFNT